MTTSPRFQVIVRIHPGCRPIVLKVMYATTGISCFSVRLTEIASEQGKVIKLYSDFR